MKNWGTSEYLAGAAIILLAYLYYKHDKLIKDLKADDNKASLAGASSAVKKDLNIT